ncbi:MAG: hypothetical protein M0T73_06045 [Deltaproteobacteria bacterium]|nr:hypothetical protein [Deltaproteobacteria bacterium]
MQALSKLILVIAVFLAFALIISGYAIWSGQTSMFRIDSVENNPLGDTLIYRANTTDQLRLSVPDPATIGVGVGSVARNTEQHSPK